jgi:hypothetical protein
VGVPGPFGSTLRVHAMNAVDMHAMNAVDVHVLNAACMP